MPIAQSFGEFSSSLARELERREQQVCDDREAIARSQRWPVTFGVQGYLVRQALELSGLEYNAEGAVVPIKSTKEKPLPPPRVRLSAMRILASCDKLVLEQRKLEFQDNPDADAEEALTPWQVLKSMPMSPEVAREALVLVAPPPPPPTLDDHPSARKPPEPPPAPARDERDLPPAFVLPQTGRDRWPITQDLRGAVVVSTLGVCGQSISPDGKVSPLLKPDGTPQPKPRRRILLSALRLLTRFDGLSLMEQKQNRSIAVAKRKRRMPRGARFQDRDDKPEVTWELVAKVCDMVEADARDRATPGWADRQEAKLDAEEAAGKLPWWIRKERAEKRARAVAEAAGSV